MFEPWNCGLDVGEEWCIGLIDSPKTCLRGSLVDCTIGVHRYMVPNSSVWVSHV